jgi:hypothetical protein
MKGDTMNLGTISSDAWQEFNERFPSARSFLVHAGLVGERTMLRKRYNDGWATDWQVKRLDELDALFADTVA